MPEILPQNVPPLFGDEFKNRFASWLFNKFFATDDWGENWAYPGQLTPDISQTRLPDVYSNWQPWDGGTQFLADYITNGSGIGQQDPIAAQIMRWGGPQGPGTDAMSLMMQYGAPSQAGQYVGNLAQFGISSTGAGQPLADLAYGRPTGSAQYLTPFLTSQASSYRAPDIPQTPVTRNA